MAQKKTPQSLSFDLRNANKGTERGKVMLQRSLEETGAGRSILADKHGRIIAGNKTYEVWGQLVDEAHIEVVHTDGQKLVVVQRDDLDLDDPKGIARKLAYYDNRVGQVGLDWNAEEILQDLNTGMDFSALWDAEELDFLLEGIGEIENGRPGYENPPDAEIDRAHELQEKWGVEAGQLWQLGEHRVVCGDSTNRNIIDALMEKESVETLFFDPEWNDHIAPPKQYQSALVFGDGSTIGDIARDFGSPSWLFVWDCVTCWYTSPNRPLRKMKLCAWYGDLSKYDFDGWHYGTPLDPSKVTNTRGTYEFNPDPRGKHLADIYQEPITQVHGDSLHNHSKPIEWITLLIANCTSGNIYDPFLGSGTTLLACERLGRKCRGIEISPAYVAVAIEAWTQMTGGTPSLL